MPELQTKAKPCPPRWQQERHFRQMVNADLHDHRGVGPQYITLRRPENRVHWLRVLIDIRTRITAQGAKDNAALESHPDRGPGGATPEYRKAKAALDQRKRGRQAVLQKVNKRLGEARGLIGADPLSTATAGLVVQFLAGIDTTLRSGDVAAARESVAALMRRLNGDDGPVH